MKKLMTSVAAIAAMTIAAPVAAQTAEAKTSAEVAVRTAPSEFAPATVYLGADETVTIEGCLADVTWCQVSYDGKTGWTSGQYLLVAQGTDPVLLLDNPDSVTVTTLTVPDPADTQEEQNIAAAAGATLGSLIAYAAGGPAGVIIASGIAGTTAAVAAVEPSEETLVFVTENPVETIYLNGEVVVGAGVPAEIETYEIPAQPELRYLTINGETVLVDAESNVIVRVIR